MLKYNDNTAYEGTVLAIDNFMPERNKDYKTLKVINQIKKSLLK
ncbi:hypothetical protein BJV85_001881 [Clostridium acetobutylicum]|uniref:Uncharacterized protein n=1 Tax=Clostridium acetobutylicum (strain ATCC 824 / DSM 792 / JCM 1419 / IAM 19013 / LMG 5710 / NBRC 13948 / NRRL B-527 / VKM B-1787 / 2291 / W) TaxID=272562 RepID=Q97HL6_CLOAB|nr:MULTISPECIES: hypothetical protein [Clostridium]AAK79954.1 Hypothetical protein CA_C1995 [Clostridium acetobutylicum ATCC 824]ADZ21047.1 Conserved hypothetical protein [Clostridium acetobutylicum EA 2018]AEI32118.1 hypothetical protein SMB_G2027 [Clostridium acetobutylicum DSM 1731]AWV79614.1 hypothetical protein DK921_05765 [Clostridium acetobutylicum]NOV88919.1 hypothetical protein [Clostridium acetobutylicum]